MSYQYFCTRGATAASTKKTILNYNKTIINGELREFSVYYIKISFLTQEWETDSGFKKTNTFI